MPPADYGYKISTNPFASPQYGLSEEARVWQYLDPQGLIQGKFTGIEMNSWMNAGYFSADL